MQSNYFKHKELYSFITGVASTSMSRRLLKHFKDNDIELSIEQWGVLYHLWKNDGMSQQQLCEATYKDKTSITRLVDGLENMKLVKRISSKEDRRINFIHLTKQAEELHEKTLHYAEQTINEAVAGLTHGQIEIAKEALQKVFDNLKQLS